jgi:hypothetical protein
VRMGGGKRSGSVWVAHPVRSHASPIFKGERVGPITVRNCDLFLRECAAQQRPSFFNANSFATRQSTPARRPFQPTDSRYFQLYTLAYPTPLPARVLPIPTSRPVLCRRPAPSSAAHPHSSQAPTLSLSLTLCNPGAHHIDSSRPSWRTHPISANYHDWLSSGLRPARKRDHHQDRASTFILDSTVC